MSRRYEENQEVRDKDNEIKDKSKWYTDKKRQVQSSNVTLADTVLVKQDKQNKLTTNLKTNATV